MKKLFALVALVLGVVSCQKDHDGMDVNMGGEQEVMINVSLPEETRLDSALGAFENVDMTQYDIRYIFQVFNADGSANKDMQYVYSDETTVTFPVRLIAGRKYNFAVWADLVENGKKTNNNYTIGETLKEISLNEWAPMDETRDAYTGKWNDTFSGAQNITIPLTRPFAKLRVVTTDLKELLGVVPAKAMVEYTTPYYAKFNAFAQAPVEESATAKKTHATFGIVSYDEGDVKKTLFADYIFAKDTQEVVNFNLSVFDQSDVIIGDVKSFSTPIPVKRNNLTTIEGNILTVGDNITVEIKDAFDGEYENIVGADSKSVEESLKKNSEVIYIDLTDDVALNGNGVKWGGKDTKLIIIDGQNVATRAAAENYTLTFNTTYRLHIETVNPDAKVILRNLNVTTNKESGTWDIYDIQFNCNVDIENVNFQKAIAFVKAGQTVTMKNVTINESHDYYAMWISAVGQTVNIDNLVVNSEGRGIKIDEEYLDASEVAKVTLNINGADFNTKKKAAIMVKSVAGADITLSNVDIAGVAADSSNEVWVDEDAANTINKVNVIGGSMIVEGQVTVAITDMETLKEELTKAGQAGAGYTVL